MSVPQKWKYEVPQKWKKVFIWYKVLIDISQEVEASSPEVENGIYLVEGNNWDFPKNGNMFPGCGTWYLSGRR